MLRFTSDKSNSGNDPQQIAPPPETQRLEPGFPVRDVGVDEILVALGQIDDALDEANNPNNTRRQAAGQDADQQHDDAFGGVAEDELVDSQITEQDSEDSTDDFLFGSGYFFAHKIAVWKRFYAFLQCRSEERRVR